MKESWKFKAETSHLEEKYMSLIRLNILFFEHITDYNQYEMT